MRTHDKNKKPTGYVPPSGARELRTRYTNGERYFAEAVPGGLPIIKGTKMNRKKWEKMLDEYYELHGWNKNGLPTKGALKKLGLDKEPSHIL